MVKKNSVYEENELWDILKIWKHLRAMDNNYYITLLDHLKQGITYRQTDILGFKEAWS